MGTLEQLANRLSRIAGRSYGAYKELRGEYEDGPLGIAIDAVQGDPFAAPSRLRVRLAMSAAAWPEALRAHRASVTALEDLIARRARRALTKSERVRGSGKSGAIDIDGGGQKMLERTAVRLTETWVELRLRVGLPAAGRRVLGREAKRLLCSLLPELGQAALRYAAHDPEEVLRFVHTAENYAALRQALDAEGWLAFIADGAVLPRASGESDRPLADAVPFSSPESLRATVELPHPVPTAEGQSRRVTGMGLPRGISLIVGGGYHGKSTLLQALQNGVYPHIPGDGRELVATDPTAVKIRAEDGRSVCDVDIRPFIDALPGGRDTEHFHSADASGSTSQAAGIIEAIESGARTLLIDEDTAATNFMIRDARMRQLIAPQAEPIIPFVDQVGPLWRAHGCSTVLVMGGSGAYFDVADRVLMMKDYELSDVTDAAKRIAQTDGGAAPTAPKHPLRFAHPRVPDPRGVSAARGRRGAKIEAKSTDYILFGEHSIDLRALEQITDSSQLRAIGRSLHYLAENHMAAGRTIPELLDALEIDLDAYGLDILDPQYQKGRHPGEMSRPRRHEISAALNRLRSLRTLAPCAG